MTSGRHLKYVDEAEQMKEHGFWLNKLQLFRWMLSEEKNWRCLLRHWIWISSNANGCKNVSICPTLPTCRRRRMNNPNSIRKEFNKLTTRFLIEGKGANSSVHALSCHVITNVKRRIWNVSWWTTFNALILQYSFNLL